MTAHAAVEQAGGPAVAGTGCWRARSPPVFFHTTPQVVDLVKADGFMSPRPGNSFEYQPIDFHDNVYGDVFERITFRTPVAK